MLNNSTLAISFKRWTKRENKVNDFWSFTRSYHPGQYRRLHSFRFPARLLDCKGSNELAQCCTINTVHRTGVKHPVPQQSTTDNFSVQSKEYVRATKLLHKWSLQRSPSTSASPWLCMHIQDCASSIHCWYGIDHKNYQQRVFFTMHWLLSCQMN